MTEPYNTFVKGCYQALLQGYCYHPLTGDKIIIDSEKAIELLAIIQDIKLLEKENDH